MNIKKNLLLLTFLLGTFISNSQYYNGALGLNGAALKNSLHNIINNHNTQTWPLWSHFAFTDARNVNEIWDIYSDVPNGSPPYVFQIDVDKCGGYTAEGSCYNHEHTWPSTYFNDATVMANDLHHVYPTDGWVNNKRSNWPYGNVSTASWTSLNGSKLGNTNSYGAQYQDKAFEPIDTFKGDLARVYFYMSTRYQGEDAGWKNWVMADGADLTTYAITLLLQWHQLDPVSAKEVSRNNAVFAIQGNRNPFIDYPQFADCIWGNTDCTSLNIKEEELQNQLSIYPNPCYDDLMIKTQAGISLLSVELINIWGQTILKQHDGKHSIHMLNVTKGTYLVRIVTNQGVLNKMIVKN